MTHHHCTTCNRQVLHDGTTCCVCAGRGEMPEPDGYGTSPTHDPDIGSYNEWSSWYVGDDGTTSIQRYAQAKADEAERLQKIVDRLPATADGVPITPGLLVWWVVEDDEHYWNEPIGTPIEKMVESIHIGLSFKEYKGTHTIGMDDLETGNLELYSTREAAEAALAARKETDDDK